MWTLAEIKHAFMYKGKKSILKFQRVFVRFAVIEKQQKMKSESPTTESTTLFPGSLIWERGCWEHCLVDGEPVLPF